MDQPSMILKRTSLAGLPYFGFPDKLLLVLSPFFNLLVYFLLGSSGIGFETHFSLDLLLLLT